MTFLAKLGAARGTARKVRAVLHTMLNDAVALRLISANPVIRMRRGTASGGDTAKDIRPLTAEELDRLLKSAKRSTPEVATLFMFLGRTGARPGEALALVWDDIDFEKRQVRIERNLSRSGIGTTKTGRSRLVDLSSELVEALKSHRAAAEAQALRLGLGADGLSEIVFPKSAERYYDIGQVRKLFRRAMKSAGISGHVLYDLRHSFATHLLAASVPVTYVAAQLGHSKPTTTLQYYAHWLPDSSRNYVDMLDTPKTAGVHSVAS